MVCGGILDLFISFLLKKKIIPMDSKKRLNQLKDNYQKPEVNCFFTVNVNKSDHCSDMASGPGCSDNTSWSCNTFYGACAYGGGSCVWTACCVTSMWF